MRTLIDHSRTSVALAILLIALLTSVASADDELDCSRECHDETPGRERQECRRNCESQKREERASEKKRRSEADAAASAREGHQRWLRAWNTLKPGMTRDQTESLLGSRYTTSFQGGKLSVRYFSTRVSTGCSAELLAAGAHFCSRDEYGFLDFDAKGHLVEWSAPDQ